MAQARKVPNVVGLAHDVATNSLIQAGIPTESISKRRDVPAPQPGMRYTVNTQHPPAGTQLPLPEGQQVILMIFDDPAKSASAAKPRSRVQPVSNQVRQ